MCLSPAPGSRRQQAPWKFFDTSQDFLVHATPAATHPHNRQYMDLDMHALLKTLQPSSKISLRTICASNKCTFCSPRKNVHDSYTHSLQDGLEKEDTRTTLDSSAQKEKETVAIEVSRSFLSTDTTLSSYGAELAELQEKRRILQHQQKSLFEQQKLQIERERARIMWEEQEVSPVHSSSTTVALL